MEFQSFNSFNFMMNRLKTPIQIAISKSDGDPTYDDLGNLVRPKPELVEVEEPLQLATSNSAASMGVNYPVSDGGAVPISSVYWISPTMHGLEKGTLVKDVARNVIYRITARTDNPVSGLSYYALENTDDTLKGDEASVFPNN